MKIQHLASGTLLALVVCTGAARAGSENAGTTAANFLSVGTGTGVLGRGGATLGFGGDLECVPWNVASLAFVREMQISFSHASLVAQHNQEYAAVGGRLYGSPLRWSVSGLYETDGTFEGRDEFNNPTGTFDVASFAGAGHVAWGFGGGNGIGFGAKYVREDLGTTHGEGVTFDAGIQLHAGMLGIGAAAQNAFGKMRFSGAPYDFPSNYGVGVALNHATSGVRVAFDANFPSAYYTDLRTGLEWRWRELVAVRGGYRYEVGASTNDALSGPTFGFGAGVYGMWMDYAYLVPGSGDGQHRLGIQLRPSMLGLRGSGVAGATEEPKPAKAPKPPKTARAAKTKPEPSAEAAPATPEPAPMPEPETIEKPPVLSPTDPPPPPPPIPQTMTPEPAAPAAPPAPQPKLDTAPPRKETAAKKAPAPKAKPKKAKRDDIFPENDPSKDPFENAIERAKNLKP
jgi:hypothetical protein